MHRSTLGMFIMSVMMFNQTPKSQASLNAPVKVAPLKGALTCSTAEFRVPDYKKLAKNPGENKLLPRAINPRLSLIDEAYKAYKAELDNVITKHKGELNQFAADHNAKMSDVTTSQSDTTKTLAQSLAGHLNKANSLKDGLTQAMKSKELDFDAAAWKAAEAKADGDVTNLEAKLEGMFSSLNGIKDPLNNTVKYYAVNDRWSKGAMKGLIALLTKLNNDLFVEKNALKASLKDLRNKASLLVIKAGILSSEMSKLKAKSKDYASMENEVKALKKAADDANAEAGKMIDSHTKGLTAQKTGLINSALEMAKKNEAEITAIEKKHDPECIKHMKPIEDIINTFAKQKAVSWRPLGDSNPCCRRERAVS